MPRSPIAGGKMENIGLGRISPSFRSQFGIACFPDTDESLLELGVGAGGRGFKSRDDIAASGFASEAVCLLSIVNLDIKRHSISYRRDNCHEEVKMAGLWFIFEGSVCSLA